VLYVLFKTGLVAICYKGVNKLEQQRPSLCRGESDLQWMCRCNVWGLFLIECEESLHAYISNDKLILLKYISIIFIFFYELNTK
jgi:hypothetical protein